MEKNHRADLHIRFCRSHQQSNSIIGIKVLHQVPHKSACACCKKTLTPKRNRLLSQMKHSPASLSSNDNTASRRPEDDDTTILNNFKKRFKILKNFLWLLIFYLLSENASDIFGTQSHYVNESTVDILYQRNHVSLMEHDEMFQCCVVWKLSHTPAVFGTKVRLQCTFCNNVPCCNAFTRKWTKGTNYDLIVMNSVSLNSAKYEEYLNISTRTSTLTIKNFKEEDVNIPYECTYGFDTDSKVLTLNSTDFEYGKIQFESPTGELTLKRKEDNLL
ncbi:unnamed protein product [Mytilus edulis]|uniref:Uncharacterized protein n=1 Tax=Mytilus edulis TaxID=6550 RepID=A0A8S3QHF7_MYTED|nr:unnamed protein product [Mytilus edulis]